MCHAISLHTKKHEARELSEIPRLMLFYISVLWLSERRPERKREHIRYRACAECPLCHPIHSQRMNAVMPKKAAQDLAE